MSFYIVKDSGVFSSERNFDEISFINSLFKDIQKNEKEVNILPRQDNLDN